MSHRTLDERLAEELTQRGLRVTRQRVATLRLLQRLRGHPTAGEIHERLLPRHPSLSQKTVYEILDALVSAGLAARVGEAGGPSRYEARPEPHYHACCRSCGALYDLPANADAEIRGRARLPAAFQLDGIDVTLRGLCLRCRDRS